MANQKLSALAVGGTISATDLFYSSHDIGGGTFTQVSQAASALKTFVVTSPTLVTPALGTPSSGNLVNCTGLDSIVIANEGADTLCYIAFFTDPSGEFQPKTNANLTYDSSTGNLLLNQGSIKVSPATGNAVITLDPDTASTSQATFLFNQGGSFRWQLGKQSGATDAFFLYDGALVFNCPFGGTTFDFTRIPTGPTATPGTSTLQLATTAFVVASFAPLASPTFTGDPKAPTPTAGDNDTSIATTAFVTAALLAYDRPQRLISTGGVVTVNSSTDQIITFNVTSGTAPSYLLPTAAARNATVAAGVPITFKDIAGGFALKNLTITPTDTIDGSASALVLSNNYAGVTLYPRTDGGTGWFTL